VSLRLSEADISEVLAEAAKAIGGNSDRLPSTREFSLVGSRGTSTYLSVTTEVRNGKIDISVKNGGPFNLGRINMPVSHFPGNAEGFLRDITVLNPDAPPPPLAIYSAGVISRRLSARDGG